MHEKIDPKLQNMSNIQVIIIILFEGVQKKYSRGFHQVSVKNYQLYFDQGNGKKNVMYMEMKLRRIKIKGI